MERMKNEKELRQRVEELRIFFPIIRNPFSKEATVNELDFLLRHDEDNLYFFNCLDLDTNTFSFFEPDCFLSSKFLAKRVVKIELMDFDETDEFESKEYTHIYIEVAR